MPEFSKTCEYDATCINQTTNAILVEIDGLDDPMWVPQSQIDDTSEVWEKGQTGVLIISQWFAKGKGLY